MNKKALLLSLIVATVGFAVSCTYSKKEVQYPVTPNSCDTTNLTFSASIKPIFDTYCNSCHGGNASAGAGIVLDNLTEVKNYLTNNPGILLSAVKQDGNASSMPKGGGRLSDCNINKIQAWINSGAN